MQRRITIAALILLASAILLALRATTQCEWKQNPVWSDQVDCYCFGHKRPVGVVDRNTFGFAARPENPKTPTLVFKSVDDAKRYVEESNSHFDLAHTEQPAAGDGSFTH